MSMKTILDAQTVYDNSGICDFDNHSYKFNEREFIKFFWSNYDKEDKLLAAFIAYISNKNNVSKEKIIADYSLNKGILWI